MEARHKKEKEEDTTQGNAQLEGVKASYADLLRVALQNYHSTTKAEIALEQQELEFEQDKLARLGNEKNELQDKRDKERHTTTSSSPISSSSPSSSRSSSSSSSSSSPSSLSSSLLNNTQGKRSSTPAAVRGSNRQA